MVQVSTFFGIIVSMYYKDHNPPHFHAEYQGKEIRIHIQTLEIIKGKLSPKATAIIMEWAVLHQTELMHNRENARTEGKIDKIAPLE